MKRSGEDGRGNFAALIVVERVASLFDSLLDCHIVKLFGVKDFAALQAFDKLRVLMSGNNSYPGMFAGGYHRI
jgi:hypothetical protein